MLDPIWLVVIASALGTIGGLIAYKQLVSHFVESSSEEEFFARRQQAFSQFLVRYITAEAIPIILFAYSAFIIITEGSASTGVTDVTPFLVAVILFMLFGALSAYFTGSPILRDPRASDQMKNDAKGLISIGVAWINAISVASTGLLILVLTGQV